MRTLGLIPARGGSKGLPRKNLAKIGGHSLIWFAACAAKASTLIDAIVISTDDREIRDEGQHCGVHVLMRPAELATDEAEMCGVAAHAIKQAGELFDRVFDAVVILQPTTPLRVARDIDACVKRLRYGDVDSVVTITETAPRSWMTDDVGRPIFDNPGVTNRQKLPQDYVRNGAVYACTAETIFRGSVLGTRRGAYVMPKWRSVNINDEDDLLICEAMYEHYRGGR